MPVREVSAHQLARALEAPEAERPLVLDVRNPDEVREAADRPVVVLCHHGVRSYHAAAFLESVGIPAASLRGGIEGWAVEVDPRMPRY